MPSPVGDLLGSWMHSHSQHSIDGSEKKDKLPNLLSQGAAYWKENQRTDLILKMRNSWDLRELRGSQRNGMSCVSSPDNLLHGKCGSSWNLLLYGTLAEPHGKAPFVSSLSLLLRKMLCLQVTI